LESGRHESDDESGDVSEDDSEDESAAAATRRVVAAAATAARRVATAAAEDEGEEFMHHLASAIYNDATLTAIVFQKFNPKPSRSPRRGPTHLIDALAANSTVTELDVSS